MSKKKLRQMIQEELRRPVPTPQDFPSNGSRAMITAHRIENGYLVQFFNDEGYHGRLIYCEKETDIATIIIAERAKQTIDPRYGAKVPDVTTVAKTNKY